MIRETLKNGRNNGNYSVVCKHYYGSNEKIFAEGNLSPMSDSKRKTVNY